MIIITGVYSKAVKRQNRTLLVILHNFDKYENQYGFPDFSACLKC